jgi:hypothetical protein
MVEPETMPSMMHELSSGLEGLSLQKIKGDSMFEDGAGQLYKPAIPPLLVRHSPLVSRWIYKPAFALSPCLPQPSLQNGLSSKTTPKMTMIRIGCAYSACLAVGAV